MMDDSIAEFVNSVDIGRSRVSNTPNFIFLCGGLTSKEGPCLSARDFFDHHIRKHEEQLASRVKLAETINKKWGDSDLFTDLLELEEYLAELSDLIVVFVESEGSIAELGAFAASKSLLGKTLAILSSNHKTEGTFIADGPVRRIKEIDKERVHYYPWDSKDLANPTTLDVFLDMSLELSSFLKERQHSAVKETQLVKSKGHAMLLVADLVEILGITIESEIWDCLGAWGYDLKRDELQKYLFLLEHLRLISRQYYSSRTYYIGKLRSSFVTHQFKSASRVSDRDRIKALLRQTLPQRDATRAKAFQRHLEKQSGRGAQHV